MAADHCHVSSRYTHINPRKLRPGIRAVSCVPYPLNQRRSQVTGQPRVLHRASDVEALHQTWFRTSASSASSATSTASSVHGVLLPLLLEACKLTMHVQSPLVKLDFRDPSRTLWDAEDAEDAEINRLRTYLDRPGCAGADFPCPYPGMRPFTQGDAKVSSTGLAASSCAERPAAHGSPARRDVCPDSCKRRRYR